MQNTEFKFTLEASTVSKLVDSVTEQGGVDKWVTGTYKTLLLSVKEGLPTFEPNGGGMAQSFKVCGRFGNWHRMTLRCGHGSLLCVAYDRLSFKEGKSLEWSCYWNKNNGCSICEYKC